MAKTLRDKIEEEGWGAVNGSLQCHCEKDFSPTRQPLKLSVILSGAKRNKESLDGL